MSESKELIRLRSIAWEKAKGELMGITHLFDNDLTYDDYDQILSKFIKDVENIPI